MISEFESRLAEVLGTRIAAPFQGHVDVAPGGSDARVVLGVVEAEALEPDLGSGRRAEVLPGSAVPRRAVRLRCTVALEGRADPAGRADELKALDAALYALDARELRDGSALTDSTDRGFLIQEMLPASVIAPLLPGEDAPMAIRVTATGLFWPVGAAGEAGVEIGEIRFRGGVLSLRIEPAVPLLVAGGAPAELTIRFATAGLAIADDQAVARLPFGSVAVAAVSAGGKPGKGTLGGGSAGATAGVRILEVQDDAATVTYTPPATPAVDELIVAFDDGENRLGIEIGRVPLRTGSAG